MPAVSFSSESFVKILSIKLLERSLILVGRVILGKKTLVTIVLQNIC